MYPQIFEIRIDNESKKFFAGQVVEGRVILGLNKEKVVKGIDIRLIGKGNVYWDTGIKHNHVFSESEIYINKTFNLFVPDDGRQAVLHPGTYEYYFSIPLPPKIPSSLEGQHCFIRYFLEAVIQRPWKDEQTVQTMFYVISVSDLNLSPQAALPASFQKQKHVGFNPCQNGPISLAFMIGKTGFLPGEYLQFGIEIRNTSGVRINGVHVSLKRQLNCHAKGETKSCDDKILQLNGPSSEVSGYLLWQSNFEIPSLPPTKLVGCLIINIQYCVEIKLVLEKWVNVRFRMPIIIGTIPFESSEKPFEVRKSSMSKEKPSYMNSDQAGRSAIASPIMAMEHELKYEHPWTSQYSIRSNQPIMPQPPPIPLFPTLPPLDLALFQPKPERNPYFKSFEDCDCEFSYPCRITSPDPQENTRPPRPHSNPGHFWQKSELWGDEDEQNE